MNQRSVEEVLLLLLRQDHDVELAASDLVGLSPADIGLDSLSEAELFVALAEQFDLEVVESPVNGLLFQEIVAHFKKLVEAS